MKREGEVVRDGVGHVGWSGMEMEGRVMDGSERGGQVV